MQHITATSSVQRKPEGITRTPLPRELPPPPPTMTLSAEQAAVFEHVKRRSCVVMGPGGCGKSHMIRFMARWAEQQGITMAVTSLTGAAALVLQVPGAATLHRWSGVGLGKQSVQETLANLGNRRFILAKVWQKTQILVIDEVSMMSQKLFDLLDGVARAMRRTPNLPFGGMHVVAFGDFYQLSPVPDQRGGGVDGEETDPSGRFCFESPTWATLFPASAHFQLTQMVRQDGDPAFQAVLAEIREGNCSDATAEYLRARVVDAAAAAASGGAEGAPPPIKLYPKNNMVDVENSRAYARVVGPEQVYDQVCATDLDRWAHSGDAFGARDAAANKKASADQRKRELQFLQSGLPCAEQLRLKVGTAVVLLANLDVAGGLANGSQGTVVRFDAAAVVDLEGVLGTAVGGQPLPVVRFANGAERVIGRHWWQSATLPCVGVGQVPIKLGYSTSIHKSQGATFDSALMDIGGDVFATGQTYVGISRVRSGKGLHLMRFDRLKIRADPRVTAFHAWLAKEGGGGGGGGGTTATALVPPHQTPLPLAAGGGAVASTTKKRAAAAGSAPAAAKRQCAALSVWGDDD